ncbi:SDR family NAD(P)-dependent oxidoreductase [Curvibacter sp. HBC61]|uniref:SDR family NAD(P)-dependent oxidoreductase n=1 Tax=Curvibacter cyanobacteriorum TaxID=3026422 RepID=A0ABT5MX96_9BURK|nr:SDR family NAD(P)-dependent oxidoreductase [Curvibacter sp. HBC61]MDD0838698.1 SDR family NAD(P)-dependent oxidoreductase [Curvibacter sp. HBC61]
MAAVPHSPLFDLQGRTVLVTGATGGLGQALCQALAAHGAQLLVCDRDPAACEQLTQALRHAGHAAHALPCDLADPDQVRALIRDAAQPFGLPHGLVCNAGVQGPAGPLHAVSDAAWEQVMDINLRSVHRLCAGLLPAMAAQGGARVVLMSSIAGLRGNGRIGLYGLSKAALAQLARNLAIEWGPQGVCVNALSPGLIRTPLATELLNNHDFMSRRLAQTPLRRVGEPHEVAGLAVLLLSAAGGFITGQNLVVDGGTTVSDGS